MRPALFQNRKAEIEALIRSIPELNQALNGNYYRKAMLFELSSIVVSLTCALLVCIAYLKTRDERNADATSKEMNIFFLYCMNALQMLVYHGVSHFYGKLKPNKPALDYQAIVDAIDKIRIDRGADSISDKFANFKCATSRVFVTTPCRVGVIADTPEIVTKDYEKRPLTSVLFDYSVAQEWVESDDRPAIAKNDQPRWEIIFDEGTSKAVDALLMNELENLRDLLAARAAGMAFSHA